jgi:hypothetical protein
MVALEVIVDVHLPVAIDVIIVAFGERQALEWKSARKLRNIAKIIGKRKSAAIEIHKNELLPGFAAHRNHTHGGAIEQFDAIDFGSADEAAFERVGPAMVGAIEHVSASTTLGDGARAMTTDVAESAKSARLVTDDDDGFANNVAGEVGFGIRNGAFCAV